MNNHTEIIEHCLFLQMILHLIRYAHCMKKAKKEHAFERARIYMCIYQERGSQGKTCMQKLLFFYQCNNCCYLFLSGRMLLYLQEKGSRTPIQYKCNTTYAYSKLINYYRLVYAELAQICHHTS